MAVGFPAKTTYANGDVFSASDINDTNGTLNSAGTLVKISETSFSAVASQAIDDVFTSTYKSYLVVINNLFSSSNAAQTYIRFRYGTTTATANYYGVQQRVSFAGTTNLTTNNNAAQLNLLTQTSIDTSNPSYGSYAELSFFNVGTTSVAGASFIGQTYEAYNAAGGVVNGYNSQGQTWSGFILNCSAGNITGNVKVYGVR
jgi:hypothetical protein